MMFSTPPNALFDFDGTLVDSIPLHGEAFRAVLARVQPAALADFTYEQIKGKTTEAAFLSLGIADPAMLEDCVVEKRTLYREAVKAGRLVLLPGARRVLDVFRVLGRRLFLVTSGSAGSVHAALAFHNLADLFDGIVTDDKMLASKPAPDPYLACMARFALTPRDSFAIEDAISGVRSAKLAGLRVVGVNNPNIAELVDTFYPDLDALADALAVSVTKAGRA
jgi:beta-phosphoglucomutase